MDESLGFFLGMIVGGIAAFFIAAIVFIGGQGTDGQQFNTVCDYENGVVKQDVCIVDGKVIHLDTEDKNG